MRDRTGKLHFSRATFVYGGRICKALKQRADIAAPAVATGILLAVAWLTRRWFMDDAYIGLRYVEHVLNGQGFVFNPGERIEGVTNIGWLAAMACVGWAMPSPLAAKILGLVCAVTTLFLVCRLARSLQPEASNVCIWPLPIFLALHFEWAYYSLAGMETGLLSLCLVLMALMAKSERFRYGIPLLASFSFLLHPECVLIYPLAAAFIILVEGRPWRGEVGRAILWILILIVITSMRLAYFGDPLPNTFYAKATNGPVILAQTLTMLFGENRNVAIGFRGVAAMGLMALGAVALRRGPGGTRAVVFASIAVGLLFCIYCPMDWTYTGRYFAPYVPMALVPLWVGVNQLARLLQGEAIAENAAGSESGDDAMGQNLGRGSDRARQHLPVATWSATTGLSGLNLVSRGGGSFLASPGDLIGSARRRCLLGQAVVPVFGAAFLGVNLYATYAALNAAAIERYPGFVMTSCNLIGPATWIREHLPEDSVIASRRIGALGYFSDRRIFDFKFGLIHRDVARAIGHHDRRFEYPTDPALADAWTAVAPTHILEDREIIEHVIRETEGSAEHFVVHGLPYRVVRAFPIGTSTDWVLCERFMRHE